MTSTAAGASQGGASQGGAARGRAVVLSGAGRFADAWHPFAETSGRLATIVAAGGFDVDIASPDERMADLSDVQLVVVNIGAPSAADPGLDGAVRRGLLDYLTRGGPLLTMHVSATSLPAVPEWEPILGGIWVRGTTMHPDYGLSRVHVYPERHPIAATAGDFELYDERYSYLRVAPGVVPLATHWHDGIEHPLLWARTWPGRPAGERARSEAGTGGGGAPRDGGARVVYDALGHDGRSYDSPEHVEIVSRAVRWLTGELS